MTDPTDLYTLIARRTWDGREDRIFSEDHGGFQRCTNCWALYFDTNFPECPACDAVLAHVIES